VDDAVLSRSIQAAVAEVLEEHYKTAKDVTKIVRAKMLKEDSVFTEMFPIRVVHKGTEKGRDAAISMDGCPLVFSVLQVNPQRKRSWQTRLDAVPSWNVYVGTGVFDRYEFTEDKVVETVENFESAVQKCIVALIGHVYYDGAQ
jgi:hypothetical protein